MTCHLRKSHDFLISFKKLWGRSGFSSIAADINKMVHHGPRPLVLFGPSGSGKSTLLQRLCAEFPNKFGFSVSHTTRCPRPGEVDGVHYHFTTKEAMREAIAHGEFIESAEFSNNLYGTSKAAVQTVMSEGKVCVLDIDVQGVKQVKKTDLNAYCVFIMPPSMEELECRLRDRGTESPESLQKRLDAAKEEIEYGNTPGNCDLVVVNTSVDKAYSSLREFVVRELLKDKVDGEFPGPSRARPTVYHAVGSFIYQAMRWFGRVGMHKG